MTGMTHKQQQLLSYIETYMADTQGVAPSFDDMRDAVGLKSKSGVHRLLEGLEERGFIRRLKHRVRALELVTARPLQNVETSDLVKELAQRGWFK